MLRSLSTPSAGGAPLHDFAESLGLTAEAFDVIEQVYRDACAADASGRLTLAVAHEALSACAQPHGAAHIVADVAELLGAHAQSTGYVGFAEFLSAFCALAHSGRRWAAASAAAAAAAAASPALGDSAAARTQRAASLRLSGSYQLTPPAPTPTPTPQLAHSPTPSPASALAQVHTPSVSPSASVRRSLEIERGVAPSVTKAWKYRCDDLSEELHNASAVIRKLELENERLRESARRRESASLVPDETPPPLAPRERSRSPELSAALHAATDECEELRTLVEQTRVRLHEANALLHIEQHRAARLQRENAELADELRLATSGATARSHTTQAAGAAPPGDHELAAPPASGSGAEPAASARLVASPAAASLLQLAASPARADSSVSAQSPVPPAPPSATSSMASPLAPPPLRRSAAGSYGSRISALLQLAHVSSFSEASSSHALLGATERAVLEQAARLGGVDVDATEHDLSSLAGDDDGSDDSDDDGADAGAERAASDCECDEHELARRPRTTSTSSPVVPPLRMAPLAHDAPMFVTVTEPTPRAARCAECRANALRAQRADDERTQLRAALAAHFECMLREPARGVHASADALDTRAAGREDAIGAQPADAALALTLRWLLFVLSACVAIAFAALA